MELGEGDKVGRKTKPSKILGIGRGNKHAQPTKAAVLTTGNIERAKMEARVNPDFHFWKVMGADWLSLSFKRTVERGMMQRFVVDLKAPLSTEEIERRMRIAFRDIEAV